MMPTNHDPDCPVCFGPHHQPTHEASLDVRAWLRDEITRKLGGPSVEPEKPLRLIAPVPQPPHVVPEVRRNGRARAVASKRAGS